MIPKVVLELKGLNKSFGGLLAVKNVDMLVNESSISGLIGINGAGKTTLMNCISGIYRADSGSLDIMGVSCLNWSPHDIARLGVGRTFQILEFLSVLILLIMSWYQHLMTIPIIKLSMNGPLSVWKR